MKLDGIDSNRNPVSLDQAICCRLLHVGLILRILLTPLFTSNHARTQNFSHRWRMYCFHQGGQTMSVCENGMGGLTFSKAQGYEVH